ILDWAAARDLRPHDNPARRPNLLPKRKRVKQHFTAMPYSEIGAFMERLRNVEGVAARALEFLILTAARPGEVLGARWSEIEGDVWTVPGERMKTGRPHRVPLSKRAVELLADLPREGEYVFPGRHAGRPYAHDGLIKLCYRLGCNVTAHGFRATFKTWASERTNYPREIIEAALAHVIGDA